eukprot:2563704-Rhodomonas_salina.3
MEKFESEPPAAKTNEHEGQPVPGTWVPGGRSTRCGTGTEKLKSDGSSSEECPGRNSDWVPGYTGTLCGT